MEIEKKKRTVYTDGWHEWGWIKFLVEDGRLIRGVDTVQNKPIYPYRYNSQVHALTNVSGIKARYGIMDSVEWR